MCLIHALSFCLKADIPVEAIAMCEAMVDLGVDLRGQGDQVFLHPPEQVGWLQTKGDRSQLLNAKVATIADLMYRGVHRETRPDLHPNEAVAGIPSGVAIWLLTYIGRATKVFVHGASGRGAAYSPIIDFKTDPNLFTALIILKNGHYTSLLKVGSNWWAYDPVHYNTTSRAGLKKLGTAGTSTIQSILLATKADPTVKSIIVIGDTFTCPEEEVHADEFTTPDLLRASIFKKLDRSLDDFDPIQLRPTQSQSTEAANTGDLTGSGPFRA